MSSDAIFIFFVIAGVLYVASYGWKFFNNQLNARGEKRKNMLVIDKLASSFPEHASDFRKLDAAQIFKAWDRREEDVRQAHDKHFNDELAREKASGNSDPNWKSLQPDDWSRSSYFQHFLSSDFCSQLDGDVARWRLFVVCIENATWEGRGATQRVWIGEDGRIKLKSIEEMKK